VVYYEFPIWIRFAHFINLIFITLLIRSTIEILSALPKLYWHDHATPGTEWIKFTKKRFPPDFKKRVWIALEEEESFSFLLENNFVNWRLKVHGVVEKPLELHFQIYVQ
jgi:methionine sulfoxide reductase catalytic subunit